MKLRRNNNLLVEPPSCATGDIAFNLIVFFLVCASTQPDSGRKQAIPKSEKQPQQAQQAQNLEVSLERTTIAINGEKTLAADFVSKLKRKLVGKDRPEDRIVVVKSRKDVPYHHWITVTAMIEQAGGIITLQMEEEQQVQVP
jgi:biopolymer transport protein ExbD